MVHVKELRVGPAETREEHDVTGQQHAAERPHLA